MSSQSMQLNSFINFTALTAFPVLFRTYLRQLGDRRETWQEATDRTVSGLTKLGKLTEAESALLHRLQMKLQVFPSGRFLWCGGTPWIEKPENYYGIFNCSSTNVLDWESFGLLMNLAMTGCGTGAVLENHYINQLPIIRNRITVNVVGEFGDIPKAQRSDETMVVVRGDSVYIQVGDSREGWVKAYQRFLELSSDDRLNGSVSVTVDISNVRPNGEKLNGFGGVANPAKLPEMFPKCAKILNKAIGRKLNSVECCLLIDEAAIVVVAGSIRRCLPEDALVHTKDGLIPIKKVRIGDLVLTSKGFYPVTNFFDQGVQNLSRIKTKDGWFDCTADHKVAVMTSVYGDYEMRKTSELKPGDRLVFVPSAIPGKPTELPEAKFVKSLGYKPVKQISVPALTSDVAYFFGYFHGNGSVSSDGFRVRVAVPEDFPQIISKLVEVASSFEISSHTIQTPQDKKVKAYEIQFNGRAFNEYMSQFKKPFKPPIIPEAILQGSEDIRWAYLCGLLDADGCPSTNVLVANSHESFLKKVQAIYSSLGCLTRLSYSIRKATSKWEGELNAVGESRHVIHCQMMNKGIRYPVQARTPSSFTRNTPGFPKEMVKASIGGISWGAQQKQMPIATLVKTHCNITSLTPVEVVGVEHNVRTSHTYDIEVATRHEFVCEGILVSNSAGMRMFDASDKLAEDAKSNLWIVDADGNWKIDPDRDALRMANHTRVFHRKLLLEECIESVRKQYYSGEGAIQFAPEAIARSNADLLDTDAKKAEFIEAYCLDFDRAKTFLHIQDWNMSEEELDHRMQRYGLNPLTLAA